MGFPDEAADEILFCMLHWELEENISIVAAAATILNLWDYEHRSAETVMLYVISKPKSDLVRAHVTCVVRNAESPRNEKGLPRIKN